MKKENFKKLRIGYVIYNKDHFGVAVVMSQFNDTSEILNTSSLSFRSYDGREEYEIEYGHSNAWELV